MKVSLSLLAILLVSSSLSQAQSVVIDAGLLENAIGTAAVPAGGLLQLIASPSGTFSAPNSSSYMTGDNILIASFAMNYNSGTTGETLNTVNFSLTGQAYTLTPGEDLLLRFYPSLTYAAMPSAPTLATTYGQVRSDTEEFGASGGDSLETPWIVPAAGAQVDLDYITSDDGGTAAYTPISAFATNVVLIGGVPEPSTCSILAGAFLCLTILRTTVRGRVCNIFGVRASSIKS